MAEISRAEELRRKFAVKGAAIKASMESPKGRFSSALRDFVQERFKMFVQNRAFDDAMFARYEADAPADMQAWFDRATAGMFVSLAEPPRWLNEPDWCFHEGQPLTFVHQFTHPHGAEFYVFEGRREIVVPPLNEKGWTPFYKMQAQHREGLTVLEGEISSPVV